jgi:transcriptional regulator with XRE-family HTH domain
LNADVKKEYDSLEYEYRLLREMINARLAAEKSQADIAEKMGTTTSVVGRLETGGGNKRHSPTLATLRRYARAVDCELEIRLIPRDSKHHGESDRF